MAWLLKNLSLRRCKGIRQLVVILVLRERRSDGAAESGHTLCASSTNRSLSASPQKIPMDRHACFHRRMTAWVRVAGLEQCGCAARPGLALLLRNLLHVIHVGAGLGEDVVQVVADADEGESLFRKLADAGRAEEKQSQDDVVLARMLGQLLRGGAQLGRGVHEGKFVL